MRGKPKEGKRKTSLLLLVFSAVLLSFVSSFFLGHNGMLRLKNLKADYEQLMMENHKLALENRILMEEIRKLREDPAAIEQIAREELNFVSPHDFILVVPEDGSEPLGSRQ